MPPRRMPQVNQEPAADLPAAQPEMVVEPLYKIEKRFREQQPPKFNGLGEPPEAEQWIRTLDRIFDYMKCPDEARVSCALFQLTEEADYWWESVQRTMTLEEKDALTWEDLKVRFFEKYVPQSYRNRKEAEFLSLKQGQKSVTDYDRAFTQLSRHAPHLVDTDRKKADRFRRGLMPEICMPLAGQGELSYAQSLSRALDIEAVMPRNSKTPTVASVDHKRKWDDRLQNTTDNRGKKPWQGNTLQDQRPQQNKPNKPLCQRCKKYHHGECKAGTNQCYRCGQPGHFTNHCPQNRQDPNFRPNQAPNQAGPPRQNQHQGGNQQRNQGQRRPQQARAYALNVQQAAQEPEDLGTTRVLYTPIFAFA